jgi:hypothetical protein
MGKEHDALAFNRKVDGCARMQPDSLTEVLWDYDLPLGSDSVNHTVQV